MNKRTCIIGDCERAHNARGWCLAHYKKWQKYGDPLGKASPRERKTCSVETCDRTMYARAYCKLHYKRHMTHGDLTYGRSRRRCSVDGCDEPRHSNGYCVKHFTRWKRHGSATARMPGEVINGKRVCPLCKIDTDLANYSPGSTGRCKACVAKVKRDKYVPKPPADLPDIPCTHCGEPFKPKSVRVKLCSEKCVADRTRTVDLNHTHRYRARKRGATVERVRREEIFERDSWMCGICGDPIPKEARHPSPLSASLDHVIPLSKGGDHSMSNTQASHLRCNVSKGGRLMT